MDPDQQVARLEKLIVRLGGFPDRDLIHQITECGRLGLRTGGQALAERMCAAIMDVLDDGENGATAAERRVPLFYALDSVVKNVGDVFQPLLSVRVRAAFGRAFAACAEKDKTRLHHVLRTWNEKSAAAARTPPSSFSRSDPTVGGGGGSRPARRHLRRAPRRPHALVAPWRGSRGARVGGRGGGPGRGAGRAVAGAARRTEVADREEAGAAPRASRRRRPRRDRRPRARRRRARAAARAGARRRHGASPAATPRWPARRPPRARPRAS